MDHERSGGAESGRDPGSEPRRPRWVKVSMIAAAVALLILVLVLVGGGHGPGQHI